MAYHNFSQAQQQLAGIKAIDYFFAKEITTSLNNANEPSIILSTSQVEILTHVLMALSTSLRAGHTC
ncbi:MAG: hypothetical protein JKX76_14375, partial [Colwellia sp.]|nr:hypothetical protein [Colwellia sp.]